MTDMQDKLNEYASHIIEVINEGYASGKLNHSPEVVAVTAQNVKKYFSDFTDDHRGEYMMDYVSAYEEMLWERVAERASEIGAVPPEVTVGGHRYVLADDK